MSRALVLLREVCTSHEKMLEIASLLEWDRIGEAWNVAEKQLIGFTKEGTASLEASERAEAIQLIEKILNLQKEIALKAKPWQEDVRPLLENFSRYPLQPE